MVVAVVPLHEERDDAVVDERRRDVGRRGLHPVPRPRLDRVLGNAEVARLEAAVALDSTQEEGLQTGSLEVEGQGRPRVPGGGDVLHARPVPQVEGHEGDLAPRTRVLGHGLVEVELVLIGGHEEDHEVVMLASGLPVIYMISLLFVNAQHTLQMPGGQDFEAVEAAKEIVVRILVFMKGSGSRGRWLGAQGQLLVLLDRLERVDGELGGLGEAVLSAAVLLLLLEVVVRSQQRGHLTTVLDALIVPSVVGARAVLVKSIVANVASPLLVEVEVSREAGGRVLVIPVVPVQQEEHLGDGLLRQHILNGVGHQLKVPGAAVSRVLGSGALVLWRGCWRLRLFEAAERMEAVIPGGLMRFDRGSIDPVSPVMAVLDVGDVIEVAVVADVPAAHPAVGDDLVAKLTTLASIMMNRVTQFVASSVLISLAMQSRADLRYQEAVLRLDNLTIVHAASLADL